MNLHLLGTGGFYPTESRQTPCYMIPTEGLVLDAGTGFSRIRDLIQTPTLDIFITHAHLDHICGLTYLLAMVLEKNVKVTVHCEAHVGEVIRNQLYASALFPLKFDYGMNIIEPGNFKFRDWDVTVVRQPHGAETSLGFTFRNGPASFAYLTDTTVTEDTPCEHVKGVNWLLHECYFQDVHASYAKASGHSYAQAVADFAERSGVPKLALIHVNPLYLTEDLSELSLPMRTSHIIPYDKQVINLLL